jgi:DNA-binding NtrC family response regulator
VGQRILIVDDKPDVRDSVGEFMRQAGFAADSAASVDDALALLRAASFDVVITDIEFPNGVGGLDLTQMIKKEHHADVIVMTGYSHNYSYEEAVSRGASDFVVKPFRTEELLLRVRRVLRERELRKERKRMMEKLQKLAVTDGNHTVQLAAFLHPARAGWTAAPYNTPLPAAPRHRPLQGLQRRLRTPRRRQGAGAVPARS